MLIRQRLMAQEPHFDIQYLEPRLSEEEAAGLNAEEKAQLRASKYGRPLHTVFVPSGEKGKRIPLDCVVASWRGPQTLAELKSRGVNILADCRPHLEKNFNDEWVAKGLDIDWSI
jgi:hypothetical protein